MLEFLEQIFSFYSADSDTDATVTCSGVVWYCPLVSRGTDVDLLPEFVIFMIAPSPKIGGTNTFNLGGTWYLMSWYRYQRPPLSPPSKDYEDYCRSLLQEGTTVKHDGRSQRFTSNVKFENYRTIKLSDKSLIVQNMLMSERFLVRKFLKFIENRKTQRNVT